MNYLIGIIEREFNSAVSHARQMRLIGRYDSALLSIRHAKECKFVLNVIGKSLEVSKIIDAIRDSFHNSEFVYTQGGCYRFYKILKAIFPQANGYYNSDHVITQIDGKFYDITGEVKKENHLLIQVHYDEKKLEKLGYSGNVEIRHDESTLPKDGSYVSFQTENEAWHTGYYNHGAGWFTFGTGENSNSTSKWNVIQWRYL